MAKRGVSKEKGAKQSRPKPNELAKNGPRTSASRRSAGLLLYRRRAGGLEVFLVHPGGPFWRKKDDGAWSIPKGEIGEQEDPLDAAYREFVEETGLSLRRVPSGSPGGASGSATSGRPAGAFHAVHALVPVRQAGGKVVVAWAVEADVDAGAVRSNTFLMEWPPRSGKQQEFPEIDRAEWVAIDAARRKILAGQQPLLDKLEAAAGAAKSEVQIPWPQAAAAEG